MVPSFDTEADSSHPLINLFSMTGEAIPHLKLHRHIRSSLMLASVIIVAIGLAN